MLLSRLFTIILLVCSISSSFAQDNYYWVGGSGDWFDTSHWATTSGGSTFHDAPPWVEDTVIFDSNSFINIDQIVNVDQTAFCAILDMNAVTNNPTLQLTENLTIENSLDLNAQLTIELTKNLILKGSLNVNSDVTFSGNGVVNFSSSLSGHTIMTSGAVLGRMSFNGNGGEWTLLDALQANLITLSSGTLNFNDQDVTLSSSLTTGTSDNAFLNFGTSVVELGGSFIIGDSFRSATVDADSATLIFTGTNALLNNNQRRPVTYDKVMFIGSGQAKIEDGRLGHFNKITSTTDLELEQVTVDSLFYAKGTTNRIRTDLTVNEYLQADSITLESVSAGFQSTLNMPAGLDNYFTFITVKDINATGGATFTAGEGSIDAGNNTGWDFEFGVDLNQYYWVDGTGNWSDVNHWATSSGGSTFHTSPPSIEDTVIFDSNSFLSSGQIVTVDQVSSTKMLTANGVLNNPTIQVSENLTIVESADLSSAMTINLTRSLIINGSATLSADVSFSGNGTMFFSSSSAGHTITSSGAVLGRVSFNGNGGEWSFMDPFQASSITLSSGTLNFNDQNISLSGNLTTGSSDNAFLNMGTSTVEIGGGFIIGDSFRSATVDADSATLRFTGFNSILNDNQRKAVNYDQIEFIGSGQAKIEDGRLSHFNKISTDTDLELEQVVVDSLIYAKGTVNQIRVDLTVNEYLQADSITLRSISPGFQATLSMPAGIDNNFTYITVQDVNATGGATFTAGEGSIDAGNNTGWDFEFAIDLFEYYWVGGSGNWSDVGHWATSSGGSEFHLSAPSIEDTVIFDANSFLSSGQVVTVDQTSAAKMLITDGVLNNPTLLVSENLTVVESINLSSAMTIDITRNLLINGSVSLSSDVNFNGNGTMYFSSNSTGHTITTSGAILGRVSFNGNGGEWTMLDSFQANFVSLLSGTLNFNDQNVALSGSLTTGTSNGTFLNMGTSTVEIGGGFTIGDSFRSAIVDADSATLIFTGHNAHLNSNQRRTVSYGQVHFTGTGQAKIEDGRSGHFNKITSTTDLELEQVVVDSLIYQKGSTNLIRSELTVNDYIQADSVTIRSFSPGFQATLNSDTLTQCFEYLSIRDIALSDATDFTAGLGSVDLGNNTGWTFSPSIACVDNPVCEKPFITVSNVTENTASISWSGNGDFYNLWYKAGAAAPWTKLDSIASPANLSTLSTGTRYNVRVYSFCNEISAPVATTNFDTNGPEFCQEPVVSVTNITDTTAVVSWSGNGDSYRLRYRSGYGSAWVVQDSAVSPVLITGLSTGTKYVVGILGVCNDISSLQEYKSFVTTGIVSCPTPEIFTDSIMENSAQIHWTGNADSYILRYRSGSGKWINVNDATSPYNLTELASGTQYSARIYGTCSDLTSQFSQALFKTPGQVTCEVPNISITNVSDSSAQINWSGNADDYTFRYRAGLADAWNKIENVSSPIILNTLASGTKYDIHVLGNCSEVSSLYGKSSFTTTGPVSCEQPTMTISNVTNDGAEINWTGGASISNLFYRPNGGSWVRLYNVSSPLNLSSLESGTKYIVRVYGECDGITSLPTTNNFTTSGPPACEKPIFTSSQVTDSTAEFSWTGNADFYNLRYRAGIADEWTLLENVSSPFTVNSLESGTKYDIRLFGKCGEISSFNAVLSVTTTGPSYCEIPVTTISNISDTTALVSWTGNASKYNFWYKPNKGKWIKQDDVSSPIQLSSLVAGTKYLVRVYGICDGITSVPDKNSFTTTGDAFCEKPVVTASNILDDQADISWAGNGTSYNLRYRAGIGDVWTRLNNVVSPLTISGLASGTTYNVRVDGVCGELSSLSGAVNFNTTGVESCVTPTVSVTNVSDSTAEVSWVDAAGTSILWYKETGGSWIKNNDANTPTVLSDLLPDTDYIVRVYNVCSGITSKLHQITFTTTSSAASRTNNSSSGLSDEINEGEIDEVLVSIYPNPSTGVFHINFDDLNSDISSLRMYTMSGKQELLQIELLNSDTYMIRSNASMGIYVLEFQIGNSTIRKKVFIK